MPITPEHQSALRAYERLWRSDVSDTDVEAVFAAGFRDHRPGAPEAGVAEFAGHRKDALGALSGLSARYEPVAGDGLRLAAHATVSGLHSGSFRRRRYREDAELAGGAHVRGPRRAHRRALD